MAGWQSDSRGQKSMSRTQMIRTFTFQPCSEEELILASKARRHKTRFLHWVFIITNLFYLYLCENGETILYSHIGIITHVVIGDYLPCLSDSIGEPNRTSHVPRSNTWTWWPFFLHARETTQSQHNNNRRIADQSHLLDGMEVLAQTINEMHHTQRRLADSVSPNPVSPFLNSR